MIDVERPQPRHQWREAGKSMSAPFLSISLSLATETAKGHAFPFTSSKVTAKVDTRISNERKGANGMLNLLRKASQRFPVSDEVVLAAPLTATHKDVISGKVDVFCVNSHTRWAAAIIARNRRLPREFGLFYTAWANSRFLAEPLEREGR
jgi:hypothetical protein